MHHFSPAALARSGIVMKTAERSGFSPLNLLMKLQSSSTRSLYMELGLLKLTKPIKRVVAVVLFNLFAIWATIFMASSVLFASLTSMRVSTNVFVAASALSAMSRSHVTWEWSG